MAESFYNKYLMAGNFNILLATLTMVIFLISYIIFAPHILNNFEIHKGLVNIIEWWYK